MYRLQAYYKEKQRCFIIR